MIFSFSVYPEIHLFQLNLEDWRFICVFFFFRFSRERPLVKRAGQDTLKTTIKASLFLSSLNLFSSAYWVIFRAVLEQSLLNF